MHEPMKHAAEKPGTVFGLLCLGLALLAAPAGAAESPIDAALSWSRYLGGTGADTVQRVVRDTQGNIWLAGSTSDQSSWETGAAATVRLGTGGGIDVFVAKVDPNGSLKRLVFIGGQGRDDAWGLAASADGGVVVAGDTTSADFPTTTGALKSELGGYGDAFVAKLDASGAVQWCTLLGGSSSDTAAAAASMPDGRVVVAGTTWNPILSNFPLKNPLQEANSPAASTLGFVSVLTADGKSLSFSTLWGGSEESLIRDLAVDDAGHVAVVGNTASPDLFLLRPFQGSFGGPDCCGGDAFVTVFSWPDMSVLSSSYLGGPDPDVATSVAYGGDGKLTVLGVTGKLPPPSVPDPSDFPWTLGAYQTEGGNPQAFLTKMAADGTGPVVSARPLLVWTAYVLESAYVHIPYNFRVAVDQAGRSWAVAPTTVIDTPTVPSLQPESHGDGDGTLSAFSADNTSLVFSTLLGGSGSDDSYDVTFSDSGDIFLAGTTESTDFPGALNSYHGGGDVFLAMIASSQGALAATASASPVSGLAPMTPSFAATASGGSGIYAYEWDFGDGSPHSAEQNPTHEYPVGGIYTATFTVTDSLSATASASVGITVEATCTVGCTATVPLMASALACHVTGGGAVQRHGVFLLGLSAHARLPVGLRRRHDLDGAEPFPRLPGPGHLRLGADRDAGRAHLRAPRHRYGDGPLRRHEFADHPGRRPQPRRRRHPVAHRPHRRQPRRVAG